MNSATVSADFTTYNNGRESSERAELDSGTAIDGGFYFFEGKIVS